MANLLLITYIAPYVFPKRRCCDPVSGYGLATYSDVSLLE